MGDITLCRQGAVGIITIDYPPVNALDSHAYFTLYEIMHDFAIDDEIRVVILTGAGERAFVAGADVKEFVKFSSRTGMVYTKKNAGIREYIRHFPKPVICAINGLAYGGGCALALVCDIRIACESAKLNLSEINMGIIGALRVGLVDEVVSQENLMPRCVELAEKMAAKAPMALLKAKEVLVKASESLMQETIDAESEAIRELWGTEDKTEAVQAFLEKRPPVFKGK